MFAYASRLSVLAFALIAAGPARAETPDPLRLVPAGADLVLKIEQPTRLVNLVVRLASMKELYGFDNYRELIDSTNFRRFVQIVGHFEKQVGQSWPKLLDQVAGGGVVLALQYGSPPAVVAVIQGKDPATSKKFTEMALSVVEQELARLETKDAVKRDSYHGQEVIRIGDGFHAAVLDGAIVASNVRAGVESAIDLHRDKQTKKRIVFFDVTTKSVLEKEQLKEARALVPPDALAWLYVNVEPASMNAGLGLFLTPPGQNPELAPFHVVLGGMLDVIRRSSYLTAAFHPDGDGYTLTVRIPKGREGMHEAVISHVPVSGSSDLLPLLKPKGTLYSNSFYLDLYGFWERRDKLLGESVAKQADDVDKKSGAFLLGTRLSQLLSYTGTRHRVVVARQAETGYKVQPTPLLPAFAFVTEPREPEKFAKAIEAPLRAVGFIAGFAIKLNLVEEKQGPYRIIGYRFPDEEKYRRGTFTGPISPLEFSPCFVRVGDQFVFASTLSLARELIPELEKESKVETKATSVGTALRSEFSWSGLGLYYDSIKDTVIASSVLAEGSTPEEAKRQLVLLMELFDKLGHVEMNSRYTADRYQLDFRVVPGK